MTTQTKTWTRLLVCLAVVFSISSAYAQNPVVAPADKVTVRVEAPAEPPKYSDARVGLVEDLEKTAKGFWGHAGFGDIVLQNDMATLVFGAPPEPGETARNIRAGGIIDIGPSVATPENFQLFQPNTAGLVDLTPDIRSVRFEPQANGKAAVIAEGFDAMRPKLSIRTEYVMFRDMPGVLATTTLTNTDDQNVIRSVSPSDQIFWGAMVPFFPGIGWVRMSTADGLGEFVYGRQGDVWVFIAPETGELEFRHQPGVTAVAYGPIIDMEPGESKTYRRWILTSSQDPATLYSYVLQRRQGSHHGTVLGRVIERNQTPDGAVMDRGPVADVEMRISPLIREEWDFERRKEMQNKPYLLAKTKANGQFDFLLPKGEYRIYPAPPTRFAPRPNFAARVKEGEICSLDFGVSPPSRLVYQIIDKATGERVPGKLTIEALRGTVPPELGPTGDVLSGNTVLSSHGGGIVELPPGDYRITASRGPEYNTTEKRIKLAQIEEQTVRFEIERAFDTPGWVSADIGVRTDASPASRVTHEARLVSAVAEGVEWLVTGDPGVATDLSSTVAELGLARWVRTSPGYRHSGDHKPFLGDFLLFPLDVCGTGSNVKLDGLAKADTTEALLSAMRAICPEAVVTLCRPLWPTFGYLSVQGMKPTQRTLPEGDWSRDFDAVQIWEGKRQALVTSTYEIFHAMLREGNRMAALAGSNSYGTYMEETGYPRVYIKSSTDDPARIDPAELARNIKRGLVSVTNGPFVDVRANGQPMGSQITDTDGTVAVEIRVSAANWVEISSLSVNLNGRFVRKILLPTGARASGGGLVYPREGKEEDKVIEIRVSADAVLDVMVEGSLSTPMDPVNPFIPPTTDVTIPRGQSPMALSAPILIDFDGDGQVTLPKDMGEEGVDFEGEAVNDPPF